MALGKKNKKNFHPNRRDYQSVQGGDEANHINGVPRPYLLGVLLPIYALLEGVVACASVKHARPQAYCNI